MVQELKQSTAIVVQCGPFVDVGDGFTPEVSVTLSGADEAEALKHGATTTTSISGLTWAAITGCDGYYALSLTTSETDTLGNFKVVVQDDSVCLPFHQDFSVITANAWDSKYSTDVRQVDVTQIGGDTQSATDLKDFADAGYDPGTNKVQGVVLVDTTTTNTDVRGTDSAALASVCTEGRLAELDGANLPTDVAAVKSDTADILTDTGTTLDTKIDDIQGATFATGTDSLEAIRDRGDAAWTTGAGGSNPFVLQNTTIATLATQVSFTLTAGSADDNAYLNMLVVVEDSATATQKAIGIVSAYTGATKTITLREDPGVFTMAAGDTIDVLAISPDILNILADTADMQPKLGTPAADVSADIAAVKAETALIVADTADMQPKLGAPAADVSADIAAVKVDTAATIADTADMQPKLGTPAGADMSADIAALPTANENADALLDRANGIETSYTLREALRVILSAAGGKLAGAATTTITIRDTGDAKDRITATVDADGNRSAVTLDVS